MVKIGNVLVSLDVLEKKFSCDLAACRGVCCLDGDAGAPLTAGEAEAIERDFEGIAPYMKPEGVTTIRDKGYAVRDEEDDLVTPLIKGMECAYSIVERGNYLCAIEKAWNEGVSELRKPESCHLYPLRVSHYKSYDALNYHDWSVCAGACVKGGREHMPVYRFLRLPLIRKYGEMWYDELELVAREWEKEREKEKKRHENKIRD